MSGYVVDVRLAVKWLVSEAFSEEAARLLDGKTTLIVIIAAEPVRLG